MDENDMSIQKYLILFDEVEKISMFGDDDDWILSDSDTENVMDQNELSTEPNAPGGYEYTPEMVAFNNSSTGNYQYTADVIPTYTDTETVIDSSEMTCNVASSNNEYEPNYLAPSNFYGNSTYVSKRYQEGEHNSHSYDHYEPNIPNDDNFPSNQVNDVPACTKSALEREIETKPNIVDEVCVEEMKIEFKSDIEEPVEERQTSMHQDEVVEHATVTVSNETELQHVVTEEIRKESENISDVQASEKMDSENPVAGTFIQSITNGNKAVEMEVQNIQMCIRSGCVNQAINNPEWEQEFCSNECVILHCKNVFTAWVESNQIKSQEVIAQ